MLAKTSKCSKCGDQKPQEMFWLSKKRPGSLTKTCKTCAWTARWDRINGGRLFSSTAKLYLNNIYKLIGNDERTKIFIDEIEQAVREKTRKNYNYVAIRLGRSIEHLTYVLCDNYGINIKATPANLALASENLEKMEAKYAALVENEDVAELGPKEKDEIKDAVQEITKNLIAFEGEIVAGEVITSQKKPIPPISALIRRVGSKTGNKTKAKKCAQKVIDFNKLYRNISAHADVEGTKKQELRKKDINNIINKYEIVLDHFAKLIT